MNRRPGAYSFEFWDGDGLVSAFEQRVGLPAFTLTDATDISVVSRSGLTQFPQAAGTAKELHGGLRFCLLPTFGGKAIYFKPVNSFSVDSPRSGAHRVAFHSPAKSRDKVPAELGPS